MPALTAFDFVYVHVGVCINKIVSGCRADAMAMMKCLLFFFPAFALEITRLF